jgi:hypothetical protein
MIVYFHNNGSQILANDFNQVTLDHLNSISKGWDYIGLETWNKWCDSPSSKGFKYFQD